MVSSPQFLLPIVALVLAAAAVWPSPIGAESRPDPPAIPASEAEAAEIETYRRSMGEGVLNNSVGRHQAAEEAFRTALAVCERRFGADAPECADAALRLALEISNLERYREADVMFQRAERLIKESRFPLDPPRLLTYKAMHLSNRGTFDKAIEQSVRANQLRKEMLKSEFAKAKLADSNSKRRFNLVLSDLAHGLYVQASIAFRMGKTSEAKITAHLARKLIVKARNAPDWWVSFVDTLLAEIDLAEGNIEQAEKRLRLALKTKEVALGNTRAVAISHLALGSVFRRSSRNAQAVEAMRPGLAILRGELRQTLGVPLDRIEPFLSAAAREAETTPDRAPMLHTEMFAAAQLVRTAATARTVAQIAARFSRNRPEISSLVDTLQKVTRRRDRLRLALGRSAIALRRTPDQARIAALRRDYMTTAKTVIELESKLAKVFPSYAGLVSPAPVAVGDVGALLRPDEALIRIIVGEESSFAFVVRAGGLTAARLPLSRAEIAETVGKLRAPFENVGRRVAPYDLETAHALYRKLLGPVARSLAGVRHLITVTPGALGSLPFGLLVTERPPTGENRYRGAGWLIREMAVTQMPSVRAFTSLRGQVRPSAASLPFAGFGNPTFRGSAGSEGLSALTQHCRLDAPAPADMIRRLAPLPETAAELKGVARALGARDEDVLLGADANEDRIRAMSLDRYRVLYFATHGLLPGELECQTEPALAFSPPAETATDRAADGMLEASEVAGLSLDADLVVLSACNTGRGGGDSLSDLAQAFFQAGARSMLVSHWQVESAVTARLMTDLFRRLAPGSGRRITDALRLAQLDLISGARTAHPFFWAAFTLLGEGTLDVAVSESQDKNYSGANSPMSTN